MTEKGSSNDKNENDPPAKVLKISPNGSGKNKVINVNVGNGHVLQGKINFSLLKLWYPWLLLELI